MKTIVIIFAFFSKFSYSQTLIKLSPTGENLTDSTTTTVRIGLMGFGKAKDYKKDNNPYQNPILRNESGVVLPEEKHDQKPE